MNVHLILYSNNDPFDITKKLIIDSINEYSKNNIIIHDYNLEKIMNLEWFYLINYHLQRCILLKFYQRQLRIFEPPWRWH